MTLPYFGAFARALSYTLRPFAVAAAVLMPLSSSAQYARPTPKISPPIHHTSLITPHSAMRGSDVMATVEGRAITRRELTDFWLLQEPKLLPPLGSLVADKWRAAKGAAPAYTLTESDIYARLYGDPTLNYANLLSALVSNRLVAVLAERRGIVVTPTEAKTLGHELLDDLRRKQNLTGDDATLLKTFHIPPDIFQQELVFRLRGERLLRADIEKRNGHSLRPADWFVVRQLVAVPTAANSGNPTEAEWDAARKRLDEWIVEVKNGRGLASAARSHNEDATQTADGLRGPLLLGTEPAEVEEVLKALKSGALSMPFRTAYAWYVFRIERQGEAVGEAERNQAWEQIAAARLPLFLANLRRTAKVTSVVALPETAGAATSTPTSNDNPPAPPISR